MLLYIKISISEKVNLPFISSQKEYQVKLKSVIDNIVVLNKRLDIIDFKLRALRTIVEVYPKYLRAFLEMKSQFVSNNLNQEISNKYKSLVAFQKELIKVETKYDENPELKNGDFRAIFESLRKQKTSYREFESMFYKNHNNKI